MSAPVRRTTAMFVSLGATLTMLGFGGALAAEPSAPPIVFVMFDELPTVSLLDAEGRVDAELYPHFAELASTSTWARGASTVATRLLESLPVPLTGRMPSPERTLAIRAEWPDNLFSWLEGEYALNVHEPQSLLGPTPLDAEAQARWLNEVRNDRYEWPDQGAAVDAFVAEIEGRDASRPRPTLDFIHVTLPHAPWRYGASGRTYAPRKFTGNTGSIWVDDDVPVDDAWRRHLAEVRFADALLGRILDAVRASGRFDESLIIVTAPYGAGFWPGESRRMAQRTSHPEDVLLVPLFVKRPGQTESVVSDDVVQSIDVLPTVVDVLGRAAPFEMGGCSILDAACARPEARRAMRLDGTRDARVVDAYAADLPARRASLDRKLARFPDRAHLERSWPAGRYAAWLGQPVDADIVIADGAVGSWALDRSARDWLRAKRGGPRLVAAVELAETGDGASLPWIAIELNGRLEAIERASIDRRGRVQVYVTLPEAALRERGNTLALYVVRETEAGPRLERLQKQPRGARAKRPPTKAPD